jgi:2-dehydropantoate 2-reductase
VLRILLAWEAAVKILIVGAGVIGTVYGAQLSAAGHDVCVLSHGPRTAEVAASGLSVRDALDGTRTDGGAAVVPDTGGEYDIALVAVRRDQLAPACARLTALAGDPAIIFLGNNPAGRPALPGNLPGHVYLGFPGIGGVLTRGIATYVRIRQQPTALPAAADPRLAALESALTGRGFPVQRVPDMDGWLAYHAAFVACICAALYRCGTDPGTLAADRGTLTLMCRAITEAFAALRASGTGGMPRNLAILHTPLLQPIAVRYWGRTMRSPLGELYFAAHARHAAAEMRALARDVLARIPGSPAIAELLGSRGPRSSVTGEPTA